MRPVLHRLLAGRGGEGTAEALTHVRVVPARDGIPADWPDWVPAALQHRLVETGVTRPWAHQERAASLAHAGTSVVVATGTGSGKSLAYQLPGLAALLAGDRQRVLYLAPTKALAADQQRTLQGLALPGVRAATYDGDTPREQRDWVRAHANWVLTNPDMVHRSLLPAHAHWATFLRRLRLVVIDECHVYRGVFGAHVAHVLRRLRRVCARYGSTPTFVLASATVSDPEQAGARLLGMPVRAVTEDASPRGETTFALWEPPLTSLQGENGAPVRRPAGAETARLLADLVIEQTRTLAFVRSRAGAERVALGAQQQLREAGAGELAARVAAYRGGYLPEERRALEAALDRGDVLGLAATSALELGIDVSGLDAVLLAGFPGTLASVWQRAGRAGRGASPALAVFVARDDPLDTYLVHHPEALFDRAIEASVFDPANPYVLGPQLCCAAAEAPLRPDELDLFGGPAAESVLDELTTRGVLRRRPAGWYWTAAQRPSADIRGSGEPAVSIVDAATGGLIGTVDGAAAHAQVHPGAVYLHQGRSFVVDELDLDSHVALVHAAAPDWTTWAREVTDLAVVGVDREAVHGPLRVAFGTVDVTGQVVSFLRRRAGSGEVIDETPLDLPPRRLRTRAVWYCLDPDALAAAGVGSDLVPGAAHAAEHAAIGLLPLFATCDRWDIGGVSTALHADTGLPSVFVYDGHPGGAGFAERGHAVLGDWLAATRSAIESCGCAAGCPSCVQSPKCGNGNTPLDKRGALGLLGLVLTHLGVG